MKFGFDPVFETELTGEKKTRSIKQQRECGDRLFVANCCLDGKTAARRL